MFPELKCSSPNRPTNKKVICSKLALISICLIWSVPCGSCSSGLVTPTVWSLPWTNISLILFCAVSLTNSSPDSYWFLQKAVFQQGHNSLNFFGQCYFQGGRDSTTDQLGENTEPENECLNYGSDFFFSCIAFPTSQLTCELMINH